MYNKAIVLGRIANDLVLRKTVKDEDGRRVRVQRIKVETVKFTSFENFIGKDNELMPEVETEEIRKESDEGIEM